MKSKLLILLWVYCSFMLVACKGDDPLPDPGLEKNRTVLVYIVGDNNISRFIDNDISEMIEGMKLVDDSYYNLLVYLDSYSSEPTLFRLTKNKSGEVVQEVVKKYDEQISTDAVVMEGVMNDAFNKYPADSYGLVYWSHAEGWLPATTNTRWIGDDDGNHMNISSLKTVLSNTKHLDFILFDACFMVSIEVAYELRGYTDYLLSSPTETPGTGAPYQLVVPAMFSAGNVVDNIAEAYMEPYVSSFDDKLSIGYRNPFNAKNEWVAGVSIGVLKLDVLDRLASITKQVLPEKSVDYLALRSSIFNYDKRFSGVGYYDLANLVHSLVEENAYKEWKTVFNEACYFWETTKYCYSDSGGVFSMTGTNGVTQFIPSYNNSYNLAFRSTEWYKAAGLSKIGW